jgi:cytochrome P450
MIQDMRAPKPKSFFNKNILYADAPAILVGGTETMAAALSYSFYELAKNPTQQAQLRKAVAPVFGKTVSGNFANRDLESIPYLEAFINEILRMYNPTCNSGPRTVPPEGIEVDGVFIPGNSHVVVPAWSMQRSKPSDMSFNLGIDHDN